MPAILAEGVDDAWPRFPTELVRGSLVGIIVEPEDVNVGEREWEGLSECEFTSVAMAARYRIAFLLLSV